MKDFTNSTALVTGASSGIGAAFARALAARGANLLLVARSKDKLEALAAELASRHGITATAIPADLARPGAGAELGAEVARRGLTVDVLVNNAGFATYGGFETLPPARERNEVMVNVAAVVDLAHAFLPGMLSRRRGAIVNVASTGAFQPVPYMAVYGATKAFVLSFSEALWAETQGRGVSVLALCPGKTDTAFFDVAGHTADFGPPAEQPEVVVERALRSRGTGASSSWARGTGCWRPRRASPRARNVARLTARMFRPREAPTQRAD